MNSTFDPRTVLNTALAAFDAACQSAFGGPAAAWKALVVGGGRRATIAPNLGNGQLDWVLHPFTEYFNDEGSSVWTTHDVALLGVRDGARVALDQPVSSESSQEWHYPWSGYRSDWTTISDENCTGWTSRNFDQIGAFAGDDLAYLGATEPCDRDQSLVCVEQ